jgi:DNA invertase Pin-like site-specific DNA recombinase
MTRAQKFIKLFDNGMRKSEAARVFNSSRNAIELWLKWQNHNKKPKYQSQDLSWLGSSRLTAGDLWQRRSGI